MSSPTHLWRFTSYFTFYLISSLVIYFGTAFTIPTWLVYLFALLPFCLVCLFTLIYLSFKRGKTHWIRYRKLLILPIAISQILTIISSPASCIG